MGRNTICFLSRSGWALECGEGQHLVRLSALAGVSKGRREAYSWHEDGIFSHEKMGTSLHNSFHAHAPT